MTEKQNIIGLSKLELDEKLAALGLEKFRLKQVWQWVYFYGRYRFRQNDQSRQSPAPDIGR